MTVSKSPLKVPLSVFLSVLVVLSIACGGDDDGVKPEPPPEGNAPGTVTDLTVTLTTDSSATLSWTAPGDDGTTGQASSYDIRYATFPIDAGNFESAAEVSDPPSPGAAGAVDTFTVTGLTGTTRYYFALKTGDEVPNWSGASNTPTTFTDARFLTMWGYNGWPDGRFQQPRGIAVDHSTNEVYTVEFTNVRVQVFDLDGNYLRKWGDRGSGDGQFEGATAIAVNSYGSVHVVDMTLNRVQEFQRDSGQRLSGWGSAGTGNGQFDAPRGIASSFADVYVADTGNDRIQRFDLVGTYVSQWGQTGTGNGEFQNPIGVELDADGNVYVVDQSNHRIQKFTADGTFLATWGSQGTGNGEFVNPQDVAIAPNGNIYVTGLNLDRVQVFDPAFNYLTQWGERGGAISGQGNEGKFFWPLSISIDSDGNSYVVDSHNCRIQKFK